MAGVLLDSLLGDRVADASAVRREAARALLLDGLPGARDEAWKYTSLRALEQRRYRDGDAAAAARAVDAGLFAWPEIDGPRLVFVNGVLRQDLSAAIDCAGLVIDWADAASPAFAPRDDARGDTRADAFVRLNTALAGDGLRLRVRDGARIAAPLHLVFVGAAADADIAWQVRASIGIGAGAALRIVEHHVGASPNAHLGNLVMDYALASGARLELLQIQDAADAAILIRRNTFRLDGDAVLSAHTIEAGAQTMRHDFRVALAGRGARFDSRGVFALRGRQHADTHLVVGHEARDTTSDIVWRGVADQRARGVFHGAITVAAGADGADARLGNKNLLLSPQAEIDTQPVLEIHADEVKAAHGATVGQLDESALFYLRSRGIPPDAARRMLVGAFCDTALSALEPSALRDRVAALLASRLPLAEGAS
jgi:Fe-S cluster assembly protein SufD